MAANSRDQALVIVLGAGLAVAAGWFLWLSPTADSMKAATTQVQSITAEQATVSQRIAFIDATAKDLTANGAAQNLLQLAAPATPEMNNLVASVNAIAVGNGATLTSIQPQTATAQSAGQLTVSIGVTGTYQAIQGVIAGLETNERPISIQTLSLAAGSSAGNTTLVTATITFTTLTVSASTATAAQGGAK